MCGAVPAIAVPFVCISSAWSLARSVPEQTTGHTEVVIIDAHVGWPSAGAFTAGVLKIPTMTVSVFGPEMARVSVKVDSEYRSDHSTRKIVFVKFAYH